MTYGIFFQGFGHNDDGPHYIGEFNVSAVDIESCRVRVKVSESALQMFAGEIVKLSGQPKAGLSKAIVRKWGEEKIREYLQSSWRLPDCLCLGTAPGPAGCHVLASVDAQIMLRRWGILEEECASW